MYYVYVLQSQKDFGYYIGFTEDIEKRIKRHNSGFTKSIKHRIPFKLVHQEEYLTKKEAKNREKQIKSYKGGEAFKRLILSHGTGVV